MRHYKKIYFPAAITYDVKEWVGEPDKKNIYIVGNAIEAGVSRNKVSYSPEELQIAAQSLIGKPLLLNHGDDDVRNIVGKVVDARFENGAVPFKAQIDRNETAIIGKLQGGFINKVSVGALFDDDKTRRDEHGVLHPKGIEFLELSLVPVPGIPNASISQVIEEKFQQKEVVTMDDINKSEIEGLKSAKETLEAKVKSLEDALSAKSKETTTSVEASLNEVKENMRKELEEKLSEMKKDFEAKKGVTTTEDAPRNRLVFEKSDVSGKKDFYMLDEKGRPLY